MCNRGSVSFLLTVHRALGYTISNTTLLGAERFLINYFLPNGPSCPDMAARWITVIHFGYKFITNERLTFDAILGRSRADPQCDAPSFSADDFLASFKKKIADIRQDTAHSTP